MKVNVANMRESYQTEGLQEDTIERDPIKLFENWFENAFAKNVLEPNAMTLATADKNGKISARIVLLKDFDKRGFVFFTNYLSNKGKQLIENPNAALVFWWGTLAQQIRIEGTVKKISRADSDLYFNSRPRGNQLSAIVSDQSAPIPNYDYLKEKFDSIVSKLEGKKVKRPNCWGGYRLTPNIIEFWQGRENRLHDRLRFTKKQNGNWKLERLSP